MDDVNHEPMSGASETGSTSSSHTDSEHSFPQPLATIVENPWRAKYPINCSDESLFHHSSNEHNRDPPTNFTSPTPILSQFSFPSEVDSNSFDHALASVASMSHSGHHGYNSVLAALVTPDFKAEGHQQVQDSFLTRGAYTTDLLDCSPSTSIDLGTQVELALAISSGASTIPDMMSTTTTTQNSFEHCIYDESCWAPSYEQYSDAILDVLPSTSNDFIIGHHPHFSCGPNMGMSDGIDQESFSQRTEASSSIYEASSKMQISPDYDNLIVDQLLPEYHKLNSIRLDDIITNPYGEHHHSLFLLEKMDQLRNHDFAKPFEPLIAHARDLLNLGKIEFLDDLVFHLCATAMSTTQFEDCGSFVNNFLGTFLNLNHSDKTTIIGNISNIVRRMLREGSNDTALAGLADLSSNDPSISLSASPASNSQPTGSIDCPNLPSSKDSMRVCPFCFRSFAGKLKNAKSNLKRHIREKHLKAGERPYECRVSTCPSIFTREDNRKAHEREAHGIDRAACRRRAKTRSRRRAAVQR